MPYYDTLVRKIYTHCLTNEFLLYKMSFQMLQNFLKDEDETSGSENEIVQKVTKKNMNGNFK